MNCTPQRARFMDWAMGMFARAAAERPPIVLEAITDFELEWLERVMR